MPRAWAFLYLALIVPHVVRSVKCLYTVAPYRVMGEHWLLSVGALDDA